MNERIFTDKLFILIVSILFLNGCSNYKDQQVVPQETLPEAIIKVMSDAYPEATDATFQAIEKEKLYEVYYKLKGNPFYAALNTKKILSVYRMHGALPDSMKQALPAKNMSGGVAEVYKEPEIQIGTDRIYSARYTWNNQAYLLSWLKYDLITPQKMMVTVEPYIKFSYNLVKDEFASLPGTVISFLEREKLRFASATVYVNDKNEKIYDVNAYTASSTYYYFTFNAAGKLTNTTYRAEAFYYNIDEYPEKIQTFVKNSWVFSSMKLKEGYKFSDPIGTGYGMIMQGTDENCRFTFDQDGNFVNMMYQTVVGP
jgi:hypothetical protein